jgi:hypothetical protein
MSDESPLLDEAFERMAVSDFELPNGFVNHGPMACETLAFLGFEDEIDGWARRFTEVVGEGPQPTEPLGGRSFDWRGALGDYKRLPEWIGYFERGIAADGWQRVVGVWVPRLVPGMATVLFHGLIRTAHAVRAVDAVETSPRKAELARALGYWAARFQPGRPVTDVEAVGDAVHAVREAAAHGARQYVVDPNIFNLHGVTGAMAVDLLVGHIAPEAGVTASAHLRAEHGALYHAPDPGVSLDEVSGWDDGLARSAARSRDAHQVKLVEACRRGFTLIGDPSFVSAAKRVTAKP